MDFLYFYKAEVDRVVDGDTIDVTIDMGFKCFCKQRLRLLDYDTPERGEPGYIQSAKKLAGHFVDEALPHNGFSPGARAKACELLITGSDFGPRPIITVQTVKSDSFGRWLAYIWAGTPENDPIQLQSTNHLMAEWVEQSKETWAQ